VALSFRQKKEEKSAEGVSIRYYIFSKDMGAKELHMPSDRTGGRKQPSLGS